MVRRGEHAMQESDRPAATGRAEGTFSSTPQAEASTGPDMRDFPILSQIHQEIGTIASVVTQINQISDYIQGRAPSAPQEQSQQAAPHESASAQTAPTQAAPQPSFDPAAPSAVPAQQAPHAEPVQASSEGQQVGAPVVATPQSHPEVSEELINATYDRLYGFVEGVTVAVRADQPFTIDQAFVLVSEVVDTPSATDVLYRRAIYTRESSDTDQGFSAAVVLHSVNVCIYAIKIGEGLKFDRDQLIDLGVSGLLHDLGMVKLPPDFFTKGQLEPSDIERLHKHPIDGHGVLVQLGEDYSWLADIALQEHERHDGSGYPNQLQVDQIHEYARIIGVADFYAGLTRSRHDRRARLPFEAVEEIIQTHKAKFDPRVVRVLLTKLSAFPIGSLVKLNSGASGRVVSKAEDSPLRPNILIKYDAQGRKVQDEEGASTISFIARIMLWSLLGIFVLTGILWQIGFFRPAKGPAIRSENITELVAPSDEISLKLGSSFVDSRQFETIDSPAPVTPPEHVKSRVSDKKAQRIQLASPPSDPTAIENQDSYYVHTSSHKSKRAAEKELSLFAKRGLKGRLESLDIPRKGLFHRILIGPYLGKAEAREAANGIRTNHGAGYTALRKSNRL
jgi:HD-GYP domain-containing protein (c-di-GMP phosphodiesterase class II)